MAKKKTQFEQVPLEVVKKTFAIDEWKASDAAPDKDKPSAEQIVLAKAIPSRPRSR